MLSCNKINFSPLLKMPPKRKADYFIPTLSTKQLAHQDVLFKQLTNKQRDIEYDDVVHAVQRIMHSSKGKGKGKDGDFRATIHFDGHNHPDEVTVCSLPCPHCGEDLMGDGLFDSLKSIGKTVTKGVSSATNTINKVASSTSASAKKTVGKLADIGYNTVTAPIAAAAPIINAAVPTRLDFPPKVREQIAKNRDKVIDHIVVGRNPVKTGFVILMNALTLNQMREEEKKLGYDKLVHLFMLVSFTNGETLLVEKNQVINIEPISPSYPTNERMDVPLSLLSAKRLKFGDFIDNAVKAIGSPLYLYDSVKNNCQTFVINLLNSSGLLTPQLREFSFQDIEKVMSSSPAFVSKFTKLVTDGAAKANVLMNGAGVKSTKARGGYILPNQLPNQFTGIMHVTERKLKGTGVKNTSARGSESKIQNLTVGIGKRLTTKTMPTRHHHTKGKGVDGYAPGEKPAGISSDMATASQQMAARAQTNLESSPLYSGPQYSTDYTNVPRLYNPYGLSTQSNSDGSYIIPHIDEDILDLDKQTLSQISDTYGPKFAQSMADKLANDIKTAMALTTKYGSTMDQTNKMRNAMITQLQGQLNGFNIFKQIFVGGVNAIAEAVMHV